MNTLPLLAEIHVVGVVITIVMALCAGFTVIGLMKPNPKTEIEENPLPDVITSAEASPRTAGSGLFKAGLIIGILGSLWVVADLALLGFPSVLALFVVIVGGMLMIVGKCLP